MIPAGDNVDARYPAMIHASGLVTHIDEKKDSFRMAPSQYVHALRDLDPRPSFPLECDLASGSNRWKTKRPMPARMSFVAILGYLTSVGMTQSVVNTFKVEIEKVTFLGKPPNPVAAASRMCSYSYT